MSTLQIDHFFRVRNENRRPCWSPNATNRRSRGWRRRDLYCVSCIIYHARTLKRCILIHSYPLGPRRSQAYKSKPKAGKLTHTQRTRTTTRKTGREKEERGNEEEANGNLRERQEQKKTKRRRAAVCSGVSLPLTRMPPLFYD